MSVRAYTPARSRIREAAFWGGSGSARLGLDPVRVRFGSGSDPAILLKHEKNRPALSAVRPRFVRCSGGTAARHDPPVDDSEAFFNLH